MCTIHLFVADVTDEELYSGKWALSPATAAADGESNVEEMDDVNVDEERNLPVEPVEEVACVLNYHYLQFLHIFLKGQKLFKKCGM